MTEHNMQPPDKRISGGSDATRPVARAFMPIGRATARIISHPVPSPADVIAALSDDEVEAMLLDFLQQ
jgi:hypothetical protein